VATVLLLGGLVDATEAPAAMLDLVPFGSVWSFDDSGADLGSAWREPGFDDGGWSSGPGELGYGDGDEATVVSFGGDPSNKHTTTYFRRSFEVVDPSVVSGLVLRLRRDDGAVVYLNGTEVLRDNLPSGSISASTYANTWQISETTPVEVSPSPGLLVAGENTLAVEMHQAWRTSSDLTFDLDLTATVAGTGPPPTTTTTTTTTTTVPSGDEDPALLAVGDIARCGGGHPAVAGVLEGQSGTFAPLGDIAYLDGTAQEFADCYDPWFGDEFDRSRPVPGNHEYNTPGAAGYYGYFGTRAGDPSAGWYSYDLDGWHVIALNSECHQVGGCGVGSAMYQWLEADLAAAGTQCIAAYWHRARYSSEAGYVGPSYLDPLIDLLADGGVDVLLSGHAHVYERFARLDTNGDPSPSGMRHFVIGTGGHSLRLFGPPVTGSQVRSNAALGVLRLDLAADGYSWAFLPAGGATFTDAGSDTCTAASAQAMSSGHEFTDVPAWIDEAVSWIADPDRRPPFATGYPDLTYRPGLEVSRAQVARMLHRIAGSPDTGALPPHGLSDVPDWVDGAVRWLVDERIATGFIDGTFRPTEPVTRAQIARMLHRSMGSPAGAPGHRFSDVPPWVDDAIDWISDPSAEPPVATGFGDGTFRPAASVTRAQLTRMLYRLSLD
jgi:hypothetical protein